MHTQSRSNQDIPEARLKEPEMLIKIRRPPETRLKLCRPCTYLSLISNPTLELWFKYSPIHPWLGHHFWEHQSMLCLRAAKHPLPGKAMNLSLSTVGLPGLAGGLDLGFCFSWNGRIPGPQQVTWSQPINMCPVRNKGRAEKPANAQVWKKALEGLGQ